MAYTQKIIYIISLSLVISCGGGSTTTTNTGTDGNTGGTTGGNSGGSTGGNSGTTDPDDPIIISKDPEKFGDQIEYDGQEFTLTTEESRVLKFTSTNKDKWVYDFKNPTQSGKVKFTPIVLANSDAMIASGIIHTPKVFGESDFFGYDGNWSNNITSNEIRYLAVYRSMDIDGNLHDDVSLIIDMNFDELFRSRGYDVSGNETVTITFSGMEENRLQGAIHDDNGYNHEASFGLFGSDGKTMVGGYNNNWGTGVLLGNAR